MSSSSTNNSGKIWIRLFVGILALQAILELFIGGAILFDFPTTLESGFNITYTSELDVLGIALGLYLLLLTSLLVLSMIWTNKSNKAGITLGIILGVFLLTFGVVSSINSGDFQALAVDGLRGLLTIIFGFMAGKQIANSK